MLALVLQPVLLVLDCFGVCEVQSLVAQGLAGGHPHQAAFVGHAQLQFLGRAGRSAVLLAFEVFLTSVGHHTFLGQRNPVNCALQRSLRRIFSLVSTRR